MSLKPQERLKIITEYVRTGKMREGYKITESKEGKYRVSAVRDEKNALIKKRAKLVKKLAAVDKLIEEQQSNSDTAALAGDACSPGRACRSLERAAAKEQAETELSNEEAI